MKLLCINSKIIKTSNSRCLGRGLKEGEIYETKGKPFQDEEGLYNYYITGLGPKLMCRFTEALDENKPTFEYSIEELIKEPHLN
jgi:hypothetical protein